MHGHLIVSNLTCRAVRVALDVAVLILSILQPQVCLKFQFVPRSKRFHISIKGTDLLMLCREIITICSENHT